MSARHQITRKPLSGDHDFGNNTDHTHNIHQPFLEHCHPLHEENRSFESGEENQCLAHSSEPTEEQETTSFNLPQQTASMVASSRHLDGQPVGLSIMQQYRKIPSVSTLSIAASTRSTRSWRAPVTMLLSLLMGLGLAVMHHEMNVHLDMKGVDSESGRFSQQWTSRYGTALAFLVKVALVICVGTAFVQRQWLSFSIYQQPVKINDFDTISSVLGNILSLFSSLVWFKNPLLAILALISWTIPFIAVVTPGSLSVQSMPVDTVIWQTIPQQQYRNTSRYLIINAGGDGGLTETARVSKVAFASATSGQIFPMTPTYPNQSYISSFIGPALKCFNANATLSKKISFETCNGGYVVDKSIFYSWTGVWDGSAPGPLDLRIGPNAGKTFFDPDVPEGSSIFVMSREAVPADGTTQYYNFTSGLPEKNYSCLAVPVVECRLQNASYTVNFTFTNNIQSSTVSDLKYLNPVWNSGNSQYEEESENGNYGMAYLGAMSAFGTLLVGYYNESQYGFSKDRTHYDLIDIDWTRLEAISQGLEQLFLNITLGFLADDYLSSDSTKQYPSTVTIWSSFYIYNQRELLIPYSAAILVTFLCLIVGMHSFFISRTSFQNIFSTFVRAATNQYDHDIQELTATGDSGANPIPKAIGHKIIIMGKLDGDASQYSEKGRFVR